MYVVFLCISYIDIFVRSSSANTHTHNILMFLAQDLVRDLAGNALETTVFQYTTEGTSLAGRCRGREGWSSATNGALRIS